MGARNKVNLIKFLLQRDKEGINVLYLFKIWNLLEEIRGKSIGDERKRWLARKRRLKTLPVMYPRKLKSN